MLTKCGKRHAVHTLRLSLLLLCLAVFGWGLQTRVGLWQAPASAFLLTSGRLCEGKQPFAMRAPRVTVKPQQPQLRAARLGIRLGLIAPARAALALRPVAPTPKLICQGIVAVLRRPPPMISFVA